MPAATRQVLEQAGLEISDLKLLIPHQANQRIIEASARALGLSEETVFSNVERYGNTSAASIPIALCEALEQGLIQRDDVVVCVGFGAGLTWAATAFRWSVPLPLEEPSPWKKRWRYLRYRYAALRSLARRFLRWLSALLVRE
jgi:3-oxoacyl-[acyl-carrier-protein] synthase-3